MINKIMMTAFCVLLIGCASLKYPDWEYVRIENQVPSKDCVYKIQEACSLPTNQCLNWHKQRATTYSANTVVITSNQNQASYSVGMWKTSGGDNGSTVAEYYYCSGAKNIKPK